MLKPDQFSVANLLISIIVAAIPLHVSASDIEAARTNLSVDYARCYSYYMIASEGVQRGENESLAIYYEDLAALAFLEAVELSNPEVATARAQIALSQQFSEMQNNYSNLEILFVRYHNFCNSLMENPEPRLQYWLEQASE